MHQKDGDMNFVYAADDNYASILAASILSLCRWNKDINIIVIDNGISIENKNKIEDIVHKADSVISFVKTISIEKMFPFHLNMDRGSMAQFARLFLSDILPGEWDRVIYLDCDTLIRGTLNALFETDMQRMVIAGVEDAFGRLHWKKLGLGKGDVYVNSGMLLINLRRWREENIERQFREIILRKKGRIPQGDQGIINTVLKGKILKLPVRYNVLAYNFDFTYREMVLYRKPYKFYSPKEIEKAKENPVIVHFTRSFASMRPWENSETGHKYGKEWQSYYINAGYMMTGKYEKRSYKIYKMFPHLPLLFAVGILHAYVKPVMPG